MSDQLTNMGAKSRKSKYMKWLNEENQTKPSPPTINYHLVISTVSPESSDLVTLTVMPSVVTDSPSALGAFK
jgi:hypothetical protein